MDDYRNEPTAWEDLGPTRQVQAYSPNSPSDVRRAPSDEEIANELMGCLVLVVPVGMDRQRRLEWIEVASATVAHLPLDLLREGCAHARKVADHPSRIVPAIIEHTDSAVRARRNTGQITVPRERHIEPQYIKPEEAAKVLEELGIPVPDVLRPKGGL